MMLWGKSPGLAKRFETLAEAEAALEGVGETIIHGTVKRKMVGRFPAKGREHPIVIVDLDDGQRFFLDDIA